MNLTPVLNCLLEGRDLSRETMSEVMRGIMGGRVTAAQIGAFLIALRAKGESVEEVVAAAEVLREISLKVPLDCDHLVDTCGTGGDGAHTFNISTAAAFVVAAAGGCVAKHGSRSVSSSTGSADLLEAAGVRLDLTPEQVRCCVEEVGLGFLFAQRHHGAMQHAAGPRRELGVRTVFNLLGPLTNPAGAPNQVIGVFAKEWVRPLAEAARLLGGRHVLVVHAEDGLDEISIGSPTSVAELKGGLIETYQLIPEDFGLRRGSLELLTVDSAESSLARILEVFSGVTGPARDVVLLNAGAAIYAAGLVEDIGQGVRRAAAVIDSGAAASRLQALVTFTHSFP